MQTVSALAGTSYSVLDVYIENALVRGFFFYNAVIFQSPKYSVVGSKRQEIRLVCLNPSRVAERVMEFSRAGCERKSPHMESWESSERKRE